MNIQEMELTLRFATGKATKADLDLVLMGLAKPLLDLAGDLDDYPEHKARVMGAVQALVGAVTEGNSG